METIINMTTTVNLEEYQEEKDMKRIHFLHYQEDMHLHQPEIQIALDTQNMLIRINALLTVHHTRMPEIHLDVVD